MNVLISIIASIMPLVIVSIAALYSEYAGRMIFFIDGLVTVSAFICYAVTVKTGSFVFGILLCMILPAFFVFGICLIVEKFKLNSFIASLSENIFLLSLVTCLSVVFFKTRGVLVSESFSFNQSAFRVTSIISGILVCVSSILFLRKSRYGLYLRITGSDENVLINAGVNPGVYRIASWVIASVLSSVVGVLLLLRLSSFVPYISGGIGWIALAIVFLGNKKDWRVILMAVVFGLIQFAANNIQNVALFKNIPSAVLLSLPYLICILMIIVVPKKN